MNGQAVNPFLFDPSSMESNSSEAEENSTMSSASSGGEDSPLGGNHHSHHHDSSLLMNAVMMMNTGSGGGGGGGTVQTSPGMGTTPKSAGSLSKVQSQSSPLAAKSPVMSPSAPKGGGGNGGSGGGDGTEHRQKTDLFLSQFQAQMSQMKEAMDELLNKSSGSPSSPKSARASSPSGSGGGGGGRKRKGGGGGGSSSPAVAPVPPTPTITTTYQSQISTGNGLKLKIRKSSHQKRMYKKRGPKTTGGGGGGSGGGGGRKSRKKRRKGHDDDEDPISDYFDEEDYYDDIPGPSKCLPGGDDGGDSSSSRLPTGWGDQLPEAVLEKIFSHGVQNSMGGCIPFLVRVSKVSRLWRKVASKPEMWTEVDLASPRVKHVYRTERNLIYFLEHRFPHAKHLNLGGWSSAMTSQAVEALVRYCKELESLVVSSCQKLSGPNLKRITEECRCLKKLDLSSVSTTYNTKSAVSPTALQEAAEAMGSRLTYLSLANNCLANCPQVVTALADNCPNLEVLDLSNVTSPRRDTIQINVEHLQKGCGLIRVLRLTNSDIMLEHTGLKEQVSSPGFPNLEELSIAVDPKKCGGMDDGDLERIVKNAKKLRLLDVRGCGKISDSGMVRVPAWDLEHLYLSGCYATKSSNDGLELLVRKWRHSFKEIDFSWTPNENAINLAVCALADLDGAREDEEDKLPPVKVLDLCGSSVSLESIKKALKVCVYLTRLNLTSCRALPRGMKRNYANVDDVIVLREQVLSGKFDDTNND